MKCCRCSQKKGKRNCTRYGGIICSECCGKMRNIKFCHSACEYMKQQYERVDTGSVELTEVGCGKVITFSNSLFLPDILECFYCDVEDVVINIVEPTRIIFSTTFIIKKDVNRDVNLDEAYKVDAWKKLKTVLQGFHFYKYMQSGWGK